MSAIHADFAFESRLLPKVERARWKLDTMVELPNKNSLRRVRFLPALLLLVTAVCSAFVWTVSSPTGSSPDEESHISHSWGVGTGQVLPWTIEQVEHPTNGATSAVITLPAALMQHPQPSCYRDQAYNNECGPPEPAAGDVETFSYMARYPMTYYAIAGFSMRIGLASGLSGFSTLILARVVSGVVGYLLLGLASWLLARRFGWQAATIPILALMVPNTHFLLNSINPNGFEIAATAALAACVISIRHDVLRTGKCSTSLQVLLVVLILAAGWTRPLSVVWTGMILLILWVPGRRRRPLLFELSKPLVVLIFVGVAFLLGWFYYEATGTRTESVGVDEWEKLPAWLQFWMVVTRFGDMFRNGYGLLGWADYEIPLFSFILWILVACAVTTALIVGSRRTVLRPRIAAFVVLGSMVVITLQSVQTGFGWQGRYWLPPLAGALVLLVPAIQGRGVPARQRNKLWWILTGVTGLLTLHALFFNLWRYQFGLNAPFWRFSALPYPRDGVDVAWYPAGGIALFTGTLVLGIVSFALAVLLMMRIFPPEADGFRLPPASASPAQSRSQTDDDVIRNGSDTEAGSVPATATTPTRGEASTPTRVERAFSAEEEAQE